MQSAIEFYLKHDEIQQPWSNWLWIHLRHHNLLLPVLPIEFEGWYLSQDYSESNQNNKVVGMFGNLKFRLLTLPNKTLSAKMIVSGVHIFCQE